MSVKPNTEPSKVEVQLLSDDLAFQMVSRVRRAMRKSKVPEAQVAGFTREAMSGDQRHLIETCLAVTK